MSLLKFLTITSFQNTFFIGGSPCSGKSTIASTIAAEFGFKLYSVDQQDLEHVSRIQADRHPVMHRVHNLSWEEIWMRPVEQLLRDQIEYYHERFEMIIEDITASSSDHLIVEGAALLPDLLNKLPVPKRNSVFMIPTYQFQRHYYEKRSFIQHILEQCEHPETAFDNWMLRDDLFGEEVSHQALRLGYTTIRVDGSIPIEQLILDTTTLLEIKSP